MTPDHSALIERLEAKADKLGCDEWRAPALLKEAAAALREMTDWRDRMKVAASKSNDEVCQSLGKALGYPWFKDDQVNFPGSTEANGVCVGEHVAESIADEAARKITETTQWRDIADHDNSATEVLVMAEGWSKPIVAWRHHPSSRTDKWLSVPGAYRVKPSLFCPLPSAPNQANEAGE